MHARTVAESADKDEVTPREEEGEVEESDGEEEGKKKRKGPGFRDRKVSIKRTQGRGGQGEEFDGEEEGKKERKVPGFRNRKVGQIKVLKIS